MFFKYQFYYISQCNTLILWDKPTNIETVTQFVYYSTNENMTQTLISMMIKYLLTAENVSNCEAESISNNSSY